VLRAAAIGDGRLVSSIVTADHAIARPALPALQRPGRFASITAVTAMHRTARPRDDAVAPGRTAPRSTVQALAPYAKVLVQAQSWAAASATRTLLRVHQTPRSSLQPNSPRPGPAARPLRICPAVRDRRAPGCARRKSFSVGEPLTFGGSLAGEAVADRGRPGTEGGLVGDAAWLQTLGA
jgi:hypothetical protein